MNLLKKKEEKQRMEKRLTTDAGLQTEKPKENTAEDQQDNKEEAKAPQSNTVEGYALLFNQPSKDLGGFVEVIDPKALDDVDLSNVVMLDQHDYTKPLASVEAGSLQLNVDDKGLYFKATIDPAVSYANDTLNNVKNGNINSMSFRFDTDDGSDSWSRDSDGQITRTVKQIKNLFEVSTVTVPSYDQTNVNVDKTSIRSYNQFIESEENNNMQHTLIDPESNTEQPTNAFENFIRSRGEVRDGLTTTGVQAVIPEEVITPVLQLKNRKYNLAQYATVKTVSSGSGHYPIAKRNNTAVLATKEELADIADVDANMFEDVKFDVKTRAGKIALSNEIVDDSAVDIVSEVKNQLQKLVDNTDNKNIMSVLTGDTFKKKTASTTDDLKKIFNVDLDPALNKTWFVNQSGFNYLDTLKDNEGRYLLQPNPTAASGFALFGAPVVMISDTVMPNNSDGTFPMILGDIEEAVVVFRRNQVTAQWDKFDQFAQGLSVIVRNDYKPISADAAINISLSGQKAAGK